MMSRKKLKPIYDLLEVGNNKKVLQEIDRVISRATTTLSQTNRKELIEDEELTITIAKSLKCLALVRSNRLDESDKLFNELLSKNIIDDNALSIMMQYCKETQQVSKIVSFYENAVKSDPQNEDLLCSLFYAYARNQEFSKQQQIALKLYRQTNKTIYCYWQAICYVIMCEDTVATETAKATSAVATCMDNKQKEMYLGLAEKFFEKAYNEKKIEYSGGEFTFYIGLLEKRAKFEQALKLLENLNENDEKRIGILNYRLKKEINLLNKLNLHEKCKEKLEAYLEKTYVEDIGNGEQSEQLQNVDDWQYLKLYTEVNLKLNKDYKDIINYFNKLKTLKENKVKFRGPYLAILDLYQELCQNADLSSQIDEIKVNFKEFLQLFHYKPGFYYDLIYFNKLIDKFELNVFILNQIEDNLIENLQIKDAQNDDSQKLKLINVNDLNKFLTIDHIYSYITYYQLYRYFNFNKNLTSDQSIKIIKQLNHAYESGLEFGKTLLKTNQQYSDEIILLKLHFKYDLIGNKLSTKNSSKLYLSLINDLQYALQKSPANYQFKLYLVNLYSNLSLYSFNTIQYEFNLMDIKNIQYYSLSYLVLYNCMRTSAYEQCKDLLNSIRQFYITNIFDITNYMSNCYKYGTFEKLFDLYKFMIEMRKSLNLNISLQMHFLMKNFFYMNEITSLSLASNTILPTSVTTTATSTSTVLASATCTPVTSINVNGILTILQSPHSTILVAQQSNIEYLNKQLDVYFHELENNCYFNKNELNFQLYKQNLIDHNDKNVLQYWLSNENANNLILFDYNELINEQKCLFIYRNFYLKFIHLSLKLCLNENEAQNKQLIDTLLNHFREFNFSIQTKYSLKIDDEKDSVNDYSNSRPLLKLLNLKSNYLYITFKYKFNKLNEVLFENLFKKIFQLKDNYFENELKIENNKNLSICLNELNVFIEGFKQNLENYVLNSKNYDYLCLNTHLIEYLSCACEYFTLNFDLLIISIYQLYKYWCEKCSKKKSIKKKKQIYLDYQQSIDMFYEIYEAQSQLCQYMIDYLNRYIKYLNANIQSGATPINSSSTAMSIDDELFNNLNLNDDYTLNADLKQAYLCTYQQLLNQFEFKNRQLSSLTNIQSSSN